MVNRLVRPVNPHCRRFAVVPTKAWPAAREAHVPACPRTDRPRLTRAFLMSDHSRPAASVRTSPKRPLNQFEIRRRDEVRTEFLFRKFSDAPAHRCVTAQERGSAWGDARAAEGKTA